VVRARILLADDHKDMRERTALLLKTEFDVVAAVADGAEVLRAEAEAHPDVCVLDISMPNMTGIEAAIELKSRGSNAKIVFLTVHNDPDFLEAALASGGLGYVLKSQIASDLCVAIREALAGRSFITSPPVVPNSKLTRTNHNSNYLS
jgi:DNA-binding NarL/FixJ family response regulator